MKKRYNVFQRSVAFVLSLVLVLGLMPILTGNVLAVPAAIDGTKKADPSTMHNWKNFFGPDKLTTEYAGMVWTDKSVFAQETPDLPGISLTDPDNFLIALSAISSNQTVTGHTASPTDTMLVLDISGSILSTYEVGTVRQGNRHTTVEGINAANVEAMVQATNAAIANLMKQNTHNRVGVILYSGNTTTSQAATPSTATVVLPLDHYTSQNGNYLQINTTYRENVALYEWVGSYWNGSWRATGETVTYIPEGSSVTVAVADGLRKGDGTAANAASKQVAGGTYIQNGIYQAMTQFLGISDTSIPNDQVQGGVGRTPVLVLMSDGAPTIASTDYTNIGNSNTGDGGSNNDRITFLTQLTAAYAKGAISAHYKKDALFLTLGLGTSNSAAATNTLYPAGNGDTLKGYWNTYLAAQNGSTVDVISGNGTLNVVRDDKVAAMNYVDKYFYASNAEGLIQSFDDIISEIELQAEYYTTLVQGGNADLSGYVTFEDELGELMKVHDVKGILLGSTLFSGKEVAKAMNEGVLGTPNGDATELGNELVRTVKERIPGLTTTQAQQLINQAYIDQQLYYADDSNWSNYIGWYADANGNYVGFWDKDSGYEGAPANAVYANMSYGYLGVNGNSDMMHVVVMVRTDLKTLHQTVFFKIPAALLPTVTYNVTLDENNPGVVKSLERESAEPIRLVIEVGLREDINAVNLEAKVAEHIAKGGHVHRNADGSITLYTNSWAIGNDKNQNGVPDPDEVASAVVANSHFHPSYENGRYYFTEDAPVLDSSGNPVTGNTRPSGSGYQHRYNIYNATTRTTVLRPLSDFALGKAQQNGAGQWYIPKGTVCHSLSSMQADKTENVTGTLPYSEYPAVFADANVDVYNFLGNNGSIVIAPATGFTLTKQVDGVIEGVSTYTFEVTLTNIPDGAAAAPVLTDANGDALAGVTMSANEGGKFTVTMPADVTAYISGIPVGTTVSIAEKIDGDYKIVGISVAGQSKALDAPATLTVPAYNANTQMVPVVFVNAANSYGDLVISKEVTHDLTSDPAALADKVFTFRVKLAGDKILAGQTYQTSGNPVKVGADGYLTYADGSPIRLKNEESLTIYRIPEFTTYTVTEEALPGFELESINGEAVTQASGIILAEKPQVADFVNRYPNTFTPVNVELDVDVTKVLIENSPYVYDEEFVFLMQMLLPDGTYPPITDVNGESYITAKAGQTGEATFRVSFDRLGTYFFRITELSPAEQTPAGTDTPGMDYSTQQTLFQVIVTDEDMDGTPEITVRDEAHVTTGATYENNDPERITRISAATTFENIYELGSTNAVLNVRKDLNDAAAAGKQLTDFRFTLYPCDAAGVVAAGATGTTVTASALGDAAFTLFLNTPGTFYYKVVEEIPAEATLDAATGKYYLNGMYFDATAYLFTVVTDASGSDLAVVSQTLTDLATGQPVTDLTATFRNDYILEDVDVQIPLRKSLVGRELKAGETFRFHLIRTDASFHPLTGENAYDEILETGTTTLFRLHYTKVGTYHYKLIELQPAETDGLRYDTSEYHITVTVTDNGDGTLAATRQIHKLGQADPVNEAVFTNVYEVTGNQSVVLSGKKTLNGRLLYTGEFTFGLYDNPACEGTPIATATNLANGTFTFPALTFDASHLQGGDTTVYTYYVKEMNNNLPGVTYDTTVYTVTVTLGHDRGALTAEVSNNAAALNFVNTYAASGASAEINVQKILVGNWDAVANKNFTFLLYLADPGFVTAGDPIKTVTINGNGTDTITLDYLDGQEGLHYYVLKEDISGQAGGVGYDAGEYHITVSVTDPGNGKLTATVTLYRPGTGNTANAVFTNAYSVEPTAITLTGNKVFTDLSTGQPKAQTEGQFSFLVLENDKAVATGINKADGTIEFTPIRYTAAGIHTYQVIEVAGTAGGIGYDNTVFTVTVTVTDNGLGELTTSIFYTEAIEFENTYDPDATSVQLEGNKILNGREQITGEFLFEVLENGTVVATGTNRVDGSIEFTPIRYTAAGTYTYVIREKAGTNPGITYDDATFTVTVTVTDNGDGTLSATVNYGGVPVVFENTYTLTGTGITLEGNKTLTGREQVAGEFSFEVLENGTVVATGTNKADGTIEFTEILYTAPGVHTYQIVEKAGNAGGIRYDDAVFTVTVTVTDNGDGTMTATADYGATPVAFENAYVPGTVFVTLKAVKTLTGRELKDGEFTFRLMDGDEIVATATNDADGNIVLKTLSFDAAGTYTLTVMEVKGDEQYMIYDETVHTVVITVTDDGSGQLQATVTAGEKEITDGVVATFVNEYAPIDSPATGDSFDLTLMAGFTVFSGMSLILLAVLLLAENKKKRA